MDTPYFKYHRLPKMKNLLWKSVRYEYWTHIGDYEERGVCLLCNELEDMEHIPAKCEAETRMTAWKLANEIWTKRHLTPLAAPARLEDILGYGLANFNTNGKPNQAKNKLYGILVSKIAHLVWKLRNEKRIRDGEAPVWTTTKTYNRWTATRSTDDHRSSTNHRLDTYELREIREESSRR